MNSAYKDKKRIFNIEICGEYFKTSSSDIIFQYDANKICSSGTRIYKAFRATDVEEEQLIIKDYWPTDYSDTEDIRQKKMLDDITDPLERQLVERSILTPISCERVKVGDREDHTKETILRGELPNVACRVVLPLELGETGAFLPLGSDSWVDLVEEPYSNTNHRPELVNHNKEVYINRWHYRIAYKEVAIPYKNLRSLKDMALVIEHAIQGKSVSSMNDQMLMLNYLVALRIIHKAGWVHRDLSLGNLYLYIDPVSGEKRGLIGDYEFAKKVGSGGRYDIKIVNLFHLC